MKDDLAPSSNLPEHLLEPLRTLYRQLLDLHRQGMNGLWARLLKNNFAPLTAGQFDYIVGNPPWVNWENLPDEYRRSIMPLWVQYGLFPHGGMDTILGKGKKDISMLMTLTTMHQLLKQDGKLGFIITQSVFKTAGAGQGFRRFCIPQRDGSEIPLRVLLVEDMVSLNPFEGASNRTAVMILQKGEPTRYPVPYTVWRRQKGARFTYDSTLDEVTASTRRLNFEAAPVNASDPTSAWLTARPRAVEAISRVLGRSDYTAHAGVYSGGANAVYWLEIVAKLPDGLVVVRNLTEGAKVKVDEVTAPIEPDLLYPLLRGRDVKRWWAQPGAIILVPQDPANYAHGIPEANLQRDFPKTYAYLSGFKKVLQNRPAYVKYLLPQGEPWYSLYDIKNYTFAPWKVVWREQADSLTAVVVGTIEDRCAVADHKLMLVACSGRDEAHYLCACLNSALGKFVAKAYAVEIQMGPHILEHIRIPRFDPSSAVHRRLAELSGEAHQLTAELSQLKGVSDETLQAAEQVLNSLPDEQAAEARRQLADWRAKRARLQEVEQEIDRVAAQLWGLSDADLREIQQSLREWEEG